MPLVGFKGECEHCGTRSECTPERPTSNDGHSDLEPILLRRPGELPPSSAPGLVAGQYPERREAVQDLLDVALVRPLKAPATCSTDHAAGGLVTRSRMAPI
jgi:hypothetical protein